MKALRGAAVTLALLVTTPAAGQPWRYEDEHGVVTYTTDINALPKAMRDRILAKREAERKARGDAGALPPAPPARPPGPVRVAKPPRPVVDAQQPSASDEDAIDRAIEDEKAAEPAATAATRDAEIARLEAALSEAQAALLRARRKALEVPSGQAYHARTQAEQLVAELEARLKAAKADAGSD